MRFVPLLPLACGLVAAQEAPDSSRVLLWDVAVGLEMNALDMDLYRSEMEDLVEFESNAPFRNSIQVRYKGMGGGVGFASGKREEGLEVKTQSWDLQLFWYMPRVGFDLYLQNYEGYVARSDSFAGAVILPDLSMSTQTLAVYWKFFGNIGLECLSQPIARKEWISGLFYGVADLSHRRMESPSPVIPDTLRDHYGILGKIAHIDVVVPSLSVGLFLPVHFGPLYANAGMSVGGGPPFDLGDEEFRTTQSLKVNIKLAMGWEGERGGIGFLVVNDSNAEEIEGSATAQFHSLTGGVFAHRRF